jgi:hypothetical protein
MNGDHSKWLALGQIVGVLLGQPLGRDPLLHPLQQSLEVATLGLKATTN